MLIDTHAHLNFNAYKTDSAEVIKRSLENNIWMINVGSQYFTSKRAVEIAEKYQQGVYAAVGLHPIHLAEGIFKIKMDREEAAFQNKGEFFSPEQYRCLASSEKVVAIGETGLDYWYKPKTKTKIEQFKDKQKKVFSQQLDLADELFLPVIFHCRAAHNEMIDILNNRKIKPKGVIHCFTGNQEQAEKYLAMGLYLGLNGIIFKFKGDETSSHLPPRVASLPSVLDDIIKKIPLDKVLIETDCPYLSPPPVANKRNEPIYIKYVVEKIAQIKNLSIKEVAEATTFNAKQLFDSLNFVKQKQR
jgi:TatD DNase family protein